MNGSDKTHCLRGHEYTEANTVRNNHGNRECRKCRNKARLRYYKRTGK